ncbi:hypothetical protein GIS00_13180 [Nakamurella sp. YIM 132087]|uniref:Uncharacterized protein n=1 Tax=Nakamurella alba TaxID=2665158 RepID=A0A7K1FNU4_9ACTN|nr:hypothetical protein [Nakamurella alba]MTD14893.1 hypothetical protein [Nakamurella alba]
MNTDLITEPAGLALIGGTLLLLAVTAVLRERRVDGAGEALPAPPRWPLRIVVCLLVLAVLALVLITVLRFSVLT